MATTIVRYRSKIITKQHEKKDWEVINVMTNLCVVCVIKKLCKSRKFGIGTRNNIS